MQRALNKCSYEPVHLVPLVQAGGLLLTLEVALEQANSLGVATPHSVKILQASSNTPAYGLAEARDLIQTDFLNLFTLSGSLELKAALVQLSSKPPKRRSDHVRVDENPTFPSPQDFAPGASEGEMKVWWENLYSEEDCKDYLESLSANPKDQPGLSSCQDPVLVSMFSVMHNAKQLCVAEIEMLQPSERPCFQEFSVLRDLNSTWGRLSACTSLEEVYEEAVSIVHQEIKYDRVMFYKFDPEGNGQVVAERLTARADRRPVSYKGLHFPATDVPDQAKALIKRVGIRHVRAVSVQPFALVPPVLDNMLVDLSDSKLRQTSIMHVKYLRNMKVESTTTLAVCLDGELYGMIACHNTNEKGLTPSLYFKLKLIGSIVGQVIENLTVQYRKKVYNNLEKHVKVDSMVLREDPETVLQVLGKELCLQLNASSLLVAVSKSGLIAENFQEGQDVRSRTALNVHCSGELNLPTSALRELLRRMVFELPDENMFMFNSLKEVSSSIWQYVVELEQQRGLLRAEELCGIAAIRSRTCFVVFVRNAKELSVKWAGKDSTKIESEAKQKWLEPRNSFEEFIASVKYCGEPWSVDDASLVKYMYSPILVLLQGMWDARATQKFLSTMSHELRTPFNGILGTLGLVLLEGTVSERLTKMIKSASLSAECVLSILDDMLILNSLKVDRLRLDTKCFNLLELLSHVKEMFAATAVKRNVSLSVLPIEGTEGVGELVRGDGRRLCQVFINLLANALKFNRGSENDCIWMRFQTFDSVEKLACVLQRERFEGKHETSLSLAEVLSSEKLGTSTDAQHPNVYLLAFVEDNGIGIPTSEIKRIFSPFEQVEGGEQRNYEGSGLGLAICQGLCKLMNGAIWCSTPKDKSRHGCSFGFVVQLSKPIEGNSNERLEPVMSLDELFKNTRSKLEFQTMTNTDNKPSKVSEELAVGTTSSSTRKILIAEDNGVSRMLLEALVRRLTSSEVLCAKDGVEAVELFEQHADDVDVCFFDYHMPRMDGLQATRESKSLQWIHAKDSLTCCEKFFVNERQLLCI